MNWSDRSKTKIASLAKRNLPTNDPLMCEVLLAQTYAQLATAEAIREQTDFLRSLPVHHPVYHNYFEEEREMQFQKNSLSTAISIARTLGIISEYIHEILKIMRKK